MATGRPATPVKPLLCSVASAKHVPPNGWQDRLYDELRRKMDKTPGGSHQYEMNFIEGQDYTTRTQYRRVDHMGIKHDPRTMFNESVKGSHLEEVLEFIKHHGLKHEVKLHNHEHAQKSGPLSYGTWLQLEILW